MGWWRGIAYSPVAWYPIDDLIAEIRCVLLILHLGAVAWFSYYIFVMVGYVHGT